MKFSREQDQELVPVSRRFNFQIFAPSMGKLVAIVSRRFLFAGKREIKFPGLAQFWSAAVSISGRVGRERKDWRDRLIEFYC